MVEESPRKYKRAIMMNSALLVPQADQNAIEVLIVNVSYGGIGMYIPKKLVVGTDVTIKILYSEGRPEKLTESVSGTVRWCRPMGSWFGLGVELKHLNPKEHVSLIKFIEQTPGV